MLRKFRLVTENKMDMNTLEHHQSESQVGKCVTSIFAIFAEQNGKKNHWTV